MTHTEQIALAIGLMYVSYLIGTKHGATPAAAATAAAAPVALDPMAWLGAVGAP